MRQPPLLEPHCTAGRELLAHELAHAMQQSRGVPEDWRPGSPTDSLESEANQAASDVLAGSAPPRLTASAGGLQRFQPSLVPPLPGPGLHVGFAAGSRIDICDTSINGVPGLFRHLFIVYYDASTGKEFFWRGGNTRGQPVCPGVGLSRIPPIIPLSGLLLGGLRMWPSLTLACPFNDPSLGAIGVGPLRGDFKPGIGDWPALSRRTLLLGQAADALGTGTCFKAEADRISAACVPYSPCGPNSNSVAYTLLKKCGIS
jgi:Domain of unknown function (DUF4157)